MSNGKESVEKLAGDVIADDAAKSAGRPGKAQPTAQGGKRALSQLRSRWLVPAAGIAIALLAIGSFFAVRATQGGSGQSNPASGTSLAVGSINCDCANTPAPNIGGAAVRQCIGQERQLMAAAEAGRLKLVSANDKITGFQGVLGLCDSVTVGPAGWPLVGAAAKSPYDGQRAPPPCDSSTSSSDRCLPPPS